MTRTRRIASLVAIAFVMAGVSVAPMGAAATNPVVSAQNEAASFKSWADSRMTASQQRMLAAVGSTRMAADKRQQITNDVYYSVNLLRSRVAEATKDGALSKDERNQVFVLNAALQSELSRHGSFDTWQIL
jgi:aspartokinase